MKLRKAGGRALPDGPAEIIDPGTSPEQRVKYLLAKFISSSARIISEPFFFSLRGNCKKGLLRHLGLSPKVYAALLLALDWVEFNKKGVKGLRSNIQSTFFDNASLNLRGADDKPNSGISEIISIKVQPKVVCSTLVT